MKYSIPGQNFDTYEDAEEGLAELLKQLPLGVGANIKDKDGTVATAHIELVYDFIDERVMEEVSMTQVEKDKDFI